MRQGAVQIAGVADADEARLLVECGVDYLGFPFRLDFHREDCNEEEAARIVAALPARVEAVLITYLADPSEVVALARALGVRWVQLHGNIEPEAVAALRSVAPRLSLAKSLIVRASDAAGLREAIGRYAPLVDAFVTDSFDPDTGATGATGRIHDWRVSRELASHSPRPLVLAGGLTPGNVQSAILAVRPAAVDAHTGVEGRDGRKTRALVSRFVAEARAGFARADGQRSGPVSREG
jgi:phosphoribosylanthranilate isomerase